MRGFALVALLALGLTAFAGCTGSGDPPAEPADGDGDGERRTARPGSMEADEEEFEPVELLSVPLNMTGEQEPASFDVQVPAEVAVVAFEFNGPMLHAVQLRVELTGCGAYQHGSMQGSIPANLSRELCGPAEAGAQTVTVSGTVVVFDGTFTLTGFIPSAAANATAAA